MKTPIFSLFSDLYPVIKQLGIQNAVAHRRHTALKYSKNKPYSFSYEKLEAENCSCKCSHLPSLCKWQKFFAFRWRSKDIFCLRSNILSLLGNV